MHKLVAAVIAWIFFGVVHAEARNPLDAKVIVNAGWFLLSTDTRVRVDGKTSDLVGSDIDFDDTFGIRDLDRFRLEGAWRIATRHVLRGMYFENNRNASQTIDQNVHFSDATFPINAIVTAQSEFTVAQLSYDYAFLHRDDYEMAVGIGVHYVDVDLRLSGAIDAQGIDLSDSTEADATTWAPLPVVSLRAMWHFSSNFYLAGEVQYFYLEFDPYSGSLLDLKASLVWQFSDHVGLGLAYDDFLLRFDMEDEDNFNGRLSWHYGGAIAYLSVMF